MIIAMLRFMKKVLTTPILVFFTTNKSSQYHNSHNHDTIYFSIIRKFFSRPSHPNNQGPAVYSIYVGMYHCIFLYQTQTFFVKMKIYKNKNFLPSLFLLSILLKSCKKLFDKDGFNKELTP